MSQNEELKRQITNAALVLAMRVANRGELGPVLVERAGYFATWLGSGDDVDYGKRFAALTQATDCAERGEEEGATMERASSIMVFLG